MKERILTGIKPTGIAHIGNYFGVIKSSVEMANNSENECLYFIADDHALTTIYNAEDMKFNTYNIACTWLACGLDPNKAIFFKLAFHASSLTPVDSKFILIPISLPNLSIA